jgi:hypothetical protein
MRTVLIATAAFVFHLTEMPPAKPDSTVSWQGGGFFRYREIYPDGLPRWSSGNRRRAGANQSRSAPNPSE